MNDNNQFTPIDVLRAIQNRIKLNEQEWEKWVRHNIKEEYVAQALEFKHHD